MSRICLQEKYLRPKNAFLWMASFVFWLKFLWSLFLRVQLTIPRIGLDNGLVLNKRQTIIWTNADSIHWRIYVALGGEEFEQARFKRGLLHPAFHRSALDNISGGPSVMLIFDVSLLTTQINSWTNSGFASNFRCHDSHMTSWWCSYQNVSVYCNPSWLLNCTHIIVVLSF